MRLGTCLLVAGMCFIGTNAARASTVTVGATDTGWYDNTGLHSSGNKNYITGTIGSNSYRDYFTFNLSGITDPIIGATLRVFTYDVTISSTVTLFGVTTPAPVLMSSQTGATPIFNDLGTGPVYGSRAYTGADINTFQLITLSPTFLLQANASLGNFISLGGKLLSEGTGGYVYGSSGGPPADEAQLILETAESVPLPSSVWAGMVGLVGLALHQVRRNGLTTV